MPPAPPQRYPWESGSDDGAQVFDPFADAAGGMRRRTTRVAFEYDSLGHFMDERARGPDRNARDSPMAAPIADTPAALLEDRLAQHRLQRYERLQALRQERSMMRSLLSGAPAEAASSSGSRTVVPGEVRENLQTRAASPPRSPGGIWRRRGLGDFLRGLGNGGGGGRGGLISIFDDDFPMFWGRDSAALDPRNYLVSCILCRGRRERRAHELPHRRTMTNSTPRMKRSSACRSGSARRNRKASLPASSLHSPDSSTMRGRCRVG